MPYTIHKNGSPDKPYCVVKIADGKKVGCHETAQKAGAQLAALKHNVVEASDDVFARDPFLGRVWGWIQLNDKPSTFQDGAFKVLGLKNGNYALYGLRGEEMVPAGIVVPDPKLSRTEAVESVTRTHAHCRCNSHIPKDRLPFENLTWAEVLVGSWLEAQTPAEASQKASCDCEQRTHDNNLLLDQEDRITLSLVELVIDAGFRPYPTGGTSADGHPARMPLKGTVEAAREQGVLHDHSYAAEAYIDEQGALVVEGDTGSASTGPAHIHHIRAIASNTNRQDLQIETDVSSTNDLHTHVLKPQLPELLGPADESAAEADHEDSLNMTEEKLQQMLKEAVAQAFAQANLSGKPNAPKSKTTKSERPSRTVTVAEFSRLKEAVACRRTEQGFSSLLYDDGTGVICFESNDAHRTFPNSVFAFCSALSKPEPGARIRRPIVKLDQNGMLLQEVLRTGFFVHPFYGPINVTLKKLQQIKRNFELGTLGQGVPVNIAHDHSRGALGWVVKLFIKPRDVNVVLADGSIVTMPGYSLYSLMDPTPFGRSELIDQGKYAYTSAEIAWQLEDVERFDAASVQPFRQEDKPTEEDTLTPEDYQDPMLAPYVDPANAPGGADAQDPMEDPQEEDGSDVEDLAPHDKTEIKIHITTKRSDGVDPAVVQAAQGLQVPGDDPKQIQDKLKNGVGAVYNSVLMGMAVTNIPFIPRLDSIGAMAASGDFGADLTTLIAECGGVDKALAAIDQELSARGLA